MDRTDHSGVPTPPPASTLPAVLPDYSLYRAVETTVTHAQQFAQQVAAHDVYSGGAR